LRRVLVLAYHFPPIGGAGVQRNAKFVRYLQEAGYEPVVVTGPGGGSDRWTPTDPTLEGDVPAGIEVHRIQVADPPRSGRWRGRAERWLDFETPWQRWWDEHAVRLGREVGATTDLIYASLVPYESAWAAGQLACELGKPWIADLQDPWALDEMMVYPSALHRRIGERRMVRALRAADAVVMNTPEARDRVLRRWPDLRRKPVVSITNGFDASDFAGEPPTRGDDAFRIVHTGYLHTELGREHRRGGALRGLLGGAIAGVDILTRSHIYLLEAVERLRREQPELGNRIEILLAGVLSSSDREVGEQSGAVRMLGYLPHAETVGLMRTADLLFLPMQDIAAGERVGIVPGKTYEYMASGTPILAAVPQGDVREFLTAVGTAMVCSPKDVGAMAEAIATAVRRKLAGLPKPAPNPLALARFERRHLTGELATLLDRTLAPRASTVREPADAPPLRVSA
jgi:glycosyltransferase involved in cell wall biosynthesis